MRLSGLCGHRVKTCCRHELILVNAWPVDGRRTAAPARPLGASATMRALPCLTDGRRALRPSAPRPEVRPLTKFEVRGLALGHGVRDLVFRRS